MTPTADRQFPAALALAMAVPFDYAGGDGVDFEPFAAFLPAEETTGWLRAWTGNGELRGDDFRVFGRDGSGGYAAVWLVRPNRVLGGQPVVLLGSEAETGDLRGSPGRGRSTACIRADGRLVANVWCEQLKAER
ncbi:hypothetical protein [Streptomyces sp. NBC_01718]|uniref:hypothetical protein n=1 Tax=Streptomyces sp. NBC_01718 TaxID=2975919 RepID=UPI00352C11F8